MKVRHTLVIILCTVLVTVCGNTISKVKLINPKGYMLSLIQETMRNIEEMEWCNLRVNDVALDLDEHIFGTDVIGRVEYVNSFVVSLQLLNIDDSSLREIWRFNRPANTTTVEVQGLMRMHNVTVGFDAIANMADGVERYTAELTHPRLDFTFTVTKDMFLDDINVSVAATVPRNLNAPKFLPVTYLSEILAFLYDADSMTVGIRNWGSDVFQPIAYKLAVSEMEFPEICYNC